MDNIPQATQNKKIPDPETNILKTPPYQGFNINDDNYYEILRLEFYNRTIDCFCQICNKESTFRRIKIFLPLIANSVNSKEFDFSIEIEDKQNLPEFLLFPQTNNNKVRFINMPVKAYALEERYFNIEFKCTRCNSQKLIFFYAFDNSKLTKIGQYPSISDLEKNAIRKYEKLLGKEKSSELNNAIRLFANGSGIGSFVYLRRIFEYLIETAHEEAKKTTNWDDNAYDISRRIEDKVKLLKDYLPPFLIENRKVYLVLSKGIHEWTEDECLSYFDPIKIIIELILDQRIEHKERMNKEKEAKNRLSKIIGEIKS